MATAWLSVQQLQDNINLIEDLLQRNGPDYADRQFYQQMLDEQHEELASVRTAQAIQEAVDTPLPGNYGYVEPPQPAPPIFPPASSNVQRKRAAQHDASYPDSKRPSRNASPVKPNNPNSFNTENSGYSSSMAGPSRQQAQPYAQPYVPQFHPTQGNQHRYRQQTLPQALSQSAQSNVIDLTESNSPTPDPFPDLNDAYFAGVAPQPVVASQQQYMSEQELGQFLLSPTPAGTNHASQPSPFPQQEYMHHQELGQYLLMRTVGTSHALQQPVTNPAYEAREVPQYIGNSNKPWAPSDNEDEYGAPLTTNEAEAVENLLGNVAAHDAEDAPERREQTPRNMCSELKEYQKIGLTWLIKVIENPVPYTAVN
jgi:hypothetical protein